MRKCDACGEEIDEETDPYTKYKLGVVLRGGRDEYNLNKESFVCDSECLKRLWNHIMHIVTEEPYRSEYSTKDILDVLSSDKVKFTHVDPMTGMPINAGAGDKNNGEKEK